MDTSETTDKILPALLAARKSIKPAGKGGTNQFHRYDYAKEEDWHTAVMPSLLANDLLLSFSVSNVINLDNRLTKKKDTEYAVQVDGVARLMHISGQWIEIAGVGQGQDAADKAAYKAMTGLKKYLYALMFALPTTDDPEKDHTPPPPQREWTEGEKVAWFRDRIAEALKAKDTDRLNKLGVEIPTKGFSKENEQTLLEKAAAALSSLEP